MASDEEPNGAVPPLRGPSCVARPQPSEEGRRLARGGPLHGKHEWYAPREVWAGPGHGGIIGGAAMMGALGALVEEPVGGLVGAAIGGRAGNEAYEEDEEAAEGFNRS